MLCILNAFYYYLYVFCISSASSALKFFPHCADITSLFIHLPVLLLVFLHAWNISAHFCLLLFYFQLFFCHIPSQFASILLTIILSVCVSSNTHPFLIDFFSCLSLHSSLLHSFTFSLSKSAKQDRLDTDTLNIVERQRAHSVVPERIKTPGDMCNLAEWWLSGQKLSLTHFPFLKTPIPTTPPTVCERSECVCDPGCVWIWARWSQTPTLHVFIGRSIAACNVA